MTRWRHGDAPKGQAYQARFDALAASGADIHGEVDFVCSLAPAPRSVLDAGCGTGRVAIELARRGIDVVGCDVDPEMLDVARSRAPGTEWVEADLAAVRLGRDFDAVVVAGNVMIFLAPGSEAEVVSHMARHLKAGGALVAGFQLQAGRLGLSAYDGYAEAAGLVLAERYATWDRQPFRDARDARDAAYAVSVHRLR